MLKLSHDLQDLVTRAQAQLKRRILPSRDTRVINVSVIGVKKATT